MGYSVNYKPLRLFTLLLIPFIILLSGCTKNANVIELSGTIESDQIDINSEVAGKIIKTVKDEGSIIQKGDIIAVVDSSNQEFAVKQQEAVVNLKQAKLDELKAGTRSQQIDQAEASVSTAKEAVSTAKTSVDNAQINCDYWTDKYNKTKSLYDSGATSENDMNDTKYKLDTANQQLITSQKQYNSSQSQLQSAQAQLNLLEAGSTSQSIRAAEADLEQSQAALDQAKLTLSKYNVISPINGTFLTKNINVGDMVNVGTSAGTVSDLTDLWVKVYIPQRNINSVKLNQDIDLKSVSLPGKTIKGKITIIASDAEFTPKNTETTEAKENTVFKLKIKIMDNIESLKPGMTITAYIPVSSK